jgi:uncharacterized protein (TIRG00374 family)
MWRAVKVLISVGALVLLLISVDWQTAMRDLRRVDLFPLSIATAILCVQFAIASRKWQIALAIHGLSWRVLPLVRISLIGFFLNNFLPTAIGGDIYRAYRTLPAEGQKSRAISALLLDRLSGMVALFIVAAVGAVAVWVQRRDPLSALLVAFFIGPLLFAAMLPWLARVAVIRRLLQKLAAIPKLEPLVHNTRLILSKKPQLLDTLAVALVFQTLAVVAIYFLFVSVDTYGVMAESAVIGAASVLASLLPVSINGIGVMEGSFALTAVRLDVAFESAVIVSLMLRLSSVVFSVIGAGVFLWDKGRGSEVAALATTKNTLD